MSSNNSPEAPIRSNLSGAAPPITQGRATIEVISASAIWGFGFVAAFWALESVGPVWMTSLRFLCAFLVIALILWRRELSPLISTASGRLQIGSELRVTFLPGLFIGSSLVLQTWALLFTTATKSAFITVLYILIVPVLEKVFLKRILSHLHFLFIFLGLVGMVLMTQVHTESFNVGDVLTLGCAFTAALHIFWISKVGHQVPSSLRFNLFQSFWAGIIPMVIAIFIEPFGDKPFTAKAVGGFIALSLGSTALAFFLQIRAQKVLSATVASMIYLLESPFGAFFAFIFLGEILKPTQWVGAFLILVAALGALAADQQTKRA